MSLVQEIPIESRPLRSFTQVLGNKRVGEIRELAADLKQRLDGRTIWNVNSTAAGGGVAEMLHTLLSYARGLEIDARWLVIGGNPDFFRLTKRIHNALHGELGDGSSLDETARGIYERVASDNAAELNDFVRAGDIVILHDPQTAGLIPHLIRRRVGVVWRCHIGNDVQTFEGDLAWNFLKPYLTRAHAFIFSRFDYLPDHLYHGRCLIVPPSIDPFSPKNQDLDAAAVRGILHRLQLVQVDGATDGPLYTRSDGTTARVERQADVVRAGPPPAWEVPIVMQVSRWDRLKDPIGVLEGFVRSLRRGGADHAELFLVGPRMEAVTDDPEGLAVYDEVLARWKRLPLEQRRRVHLVNLPMDDLQENAAMVNALQRHATIVVQKSLREGFGLTVTEAMWKAKPVIASSVGGIKDQIQHGVSGLLLKHPEDLDAFAGAVTQILCNRGLADRLGRNAKQRVTQNYLGLRILDQYDDLCERLDHLAMNSAA